MWWLAAAAVIFLASKAPGWWAAFTAAPSLCTCYAPPATWQHNFAVVRLTAAQFMCVPTEDHGSAMVAYVGVMLGQLAGWRAFRLPGDAAHIDILTQRFRVYGCAYGDPRRHAQ